ncbi:MAG: RNA polymerase factor sigma-54 [Clostridiales bacterium]|nr:RNA polymerase factor sigma-54 [Clostridiales bacterium]
MELGYGIQLEQKQLLSQSQIQSLEILAMDGVELSQFLQNEYLENPLLDCSGSHSMGSGTEEINKTFEQAATYGKNYEEIVEEDDRRKKDIPVQDQDTVKNYLLYQLPRNQFNAAQWSLMEFMIGCLDDTGFFTIPVEEVAGKTGMPVEEVERALAVLQELEPYGIFAPDLRQCLLKQLEMQEMQGSALWYVVADHLQDVADGRISNISRSLKLPTVEVRKCIEQIAKLNPRPMGEFGSGNANYIVPDIIFREEGGKWEVELNDNWVEDYHVNDYYLRMMKESSDEELTEYFRVKLERVRFVMNSIAQRRQTMLAISEAVMNRQKEYLSGKNYLEPMTMTDIAEEVGIHTSTVSRAIKGKYIQYPGGTMVMKNLFSASVTTTSGDVAVGTMQIKELIRELIDGEDKVKPYSDQAIVNFLKEKNIDISRRAVAKYREELGIKGSFDRKEIR